MLIFTQKIAKTTNQTINSTIYLTAQERLKTQQRLEIPETGPIYLRLPRGTILYDGDLLLSQTEEIVMAIAAKPEPVMTATAQNHLYLLKAVYHLGNRHIPLQITLDYLRFSPDNVLADLLTKLGLTITSEIVPFYPEIGAYQHSHH
jgi:urease accessory protein